jgi:hypothetical protein
MSRRELIRNAGIAGAVAWTTPAIVTSLASPAAAATPGAGFLCSYASIVFTINGAGPFVLKIDQDTTTCNNTNATSGDEDFSEMCNGVTYSNTCSGTALCINGSAATAYVGACPFTVNGGTVTANAGVSILFVAVHDGSFTDKFEFVCGPTTSFNVGTTTCLGPT